MRTFDRALDNWIYEAERAAELEILEVQVAFDDRDQVAHELASGRELEPADAAALARADALMADVAESLIDGFDREDDSWYDSLPPNHYARQFLALHGTDGPPLSG